MMLTIEVRADASAFGVVPRIEELVRNYRGNQEVVVRLVVAGSERELTLRDTCDAFDPNLQKELQAMPGVLVLVDDR